MRGGPVSARQGELMRKNRLVLVVGGWLKKNVPLVRMADWTGVRTPPVRIGACFHDEWGYWLCR